MAKKAYGTCCICGKDTNLTFEHIPPKAAFNHFNLRLYDLFGYLFHNRSRYTAAQNGMGKYSLCSSCNNRTGELYGAAYAEFAFQGMSYYRKQSQGLMVVPYTIYPLRVLKQIVSCFASVNGPLWCEQNPMIREFILNPNEKRFPSNIDIRMYMQEKGRTKIAETVGRISPFTGERFVGSEWGYVPFSYIHICDIAYTNCQVLNELFSVLSFLKYSYNDRVRIYLQIPRKPCNPNILDFRPRVPDLETFINVNKGKQ